LTDCYGDPLPAGAVARFGTVRLRHSSGIRSVALSPDGKLIASATSSNASVWDAGTGQELERFKRKLRAQAVAFTPDGKTLLACTRDGTVQHRDVATGELSRETRLGPGDDFQAFNSDFSPDRRLLLQVDNTLSRLRLVDVSTGKPVLRLDRIAELFSVAVSPDATTLATCARDKVVRLWDVGSGRMLRELDVQADTIFALRFSPDSKFLATSAGGTVRLWDVAGGKMVREIHEGGWSLAFAPGGKTLATASRGLIRFWDMATGQELRRLKAQGGWEIPELAFSADGRRMVSGGRNCAVTLWDVATAERLHTFEGHQGAVICLAFSPDDRRLASGGYRDGTLLVWDVATAKRLLQCSGHVPSAVCVAYSPDGKMIATGEGSEGTGDRECQIRLWDAATGRLDREFFGHLSSVQSLEYSPNGRTLASLGRDARVRLWDAACAKRLGQIRARPDARNFVSFVPDGKSLLLADAALGGGLTLTLYASDTAAKVSVLGATDEKRRVLQAGLLPDGKALASMERVSRTREGPGGRRVENVIEFRLCAAASGEILRSFTLPLGIGNELFAVSADGKTLAVGERNYGSESAVHVWDTEAGKPLVTLQGHTGEVTALAFSHAGRFLASGSGDTTVLLWDLSQLRLLGLWSRLLGKPAAADEAAKALAASPDGVVPFIRERLREARDREAPFARLIADLDNDQFEVRDKASRELARAGAAADFALRLAMEGQPSEEVRRRAEDLRRAWRQARIERLVADVSSDDPNATEAAARGLQTLDQEDAPYLRRAFELLLVRQKGNISPRARESLTGALWPLEREASTVPSPASALTLRPQAVRLGLKVLEVVGTPDARRALEELAGGPSDSRVTAEARAALRRLGRNDKEP
jgi:WD40 repeat protein